MKVKIFAKQTPGTKKGGASLEEEINKWLSETAVNDIVHVAQSTGFEGGRIIISVWYTEA